MTQRSGQAIYREAWALYYSPEHMKTLSAPYRGDGRPMDSLVKLLLTFSSTVELENFHPFRAAFCACGHPSERRPGCREIASLFWPRLGWQTGTRPDNPVALLRLTDRRLAPRAIPTATLHGPGADPRQRRHDKSLDLMTQTTGGTRRRRPHQAH